MPLIWLKKVSVIDGKPQPNSKQKRGIISYVLEKIIEKRRKLISVVKRKYDLKKAESRVKTRGLMEQQEISSLVSVLPKFLSMEQRIGPELETGFPDVTT